MPQPVPFGRRQLAAVRPQVSPPQPAQTRAELSAAAEAFRQELAAGCPVRGDFAAWKRSQTSGRILAWVATFVFLSPGLLCFVLNAPGLVSTGLTVAGLFAAGWLRLQRRRHLSAIREWGAEPDDG